MKKYIAIFIGSLLLPIYSFCVNNIVENSGKPIFINIIEREGIHTYWVPPIFVRFVLSLDNENQEFAKLFDGCRSIRFALVDKESNLIKLKSNKLIQELESSGYNSLMQIIDNTSTISIMAYCHKTMIQELVIYINNQENMFLLSLKGKMDPKKLLGTFISL